MADGTLVVLPDQDRSHWDRALIEEGPVLVRRCLQRNQPGPYQIQAAINAVLSDAATRIVYDRAMAPSNNATDRPRGRRTPTGRPVVRARRQSLVRARYRRSDAGTAIGEDDTAVEERGGDRVLERPRVLDGSATTGCRRAPAPPRPSR